MPDFSEKTKTRRREGIIAGKPNVSLDGSKVKRGQKLKTDLEVATTVGSARWPENGNLPVENV